MASGLTPMKRLLPAFLALFSPVAHAGETHGKPIADAAVLVHGIFEDGTKFKKMKARLESRGIQCYCPKLLYQDGTGGLDFLAEHLKNDIDREFGSKRKIIVIGFSMGGLVTRHYVQNLGGAERCATFITISSPHHGTSVAWTYPSEGVRQMRRGSEFLSNLQKTEHRLGELPVASYRTPMDLIILPATSSVWERADNVEFPVALHPLMLQSEQVIADIERRILK
jgi:triacylglycerol lipase